MEGVEVGGEVVEAEGVELDNFIACAISFIIKNSFIISLIISSMLIVAGYHHRLSPWQRCHQQP